MSFFIHPNQCLIFFRDPEAAFTPARMKQMLADEGLTVDGDAEPFALRFGDGPTLYASLIRGAVAAVLAARLLGRGRKHRALAAASDAYIEIKFESLVEVLGEFDTLMQTQITLQEATGGLMYLSWNQSFCGPDG